MSRFVPYETLQLLGVQNITSIQMGSNTLKHLTVLFVSVTNFQALTSKLSPEEGIKYLNAWLDTMIPNVLQVYGVICVCVCVCVCVFGRKSCKPVTRITAKKNIHGLTIFWCVRLPQKKFRRLTDFFVHAFTAKKNLDDLTIFLYTRLPPKKLLDDLTIFLYTCLPQKKF